MLAHSDEYPVGLVPISGTDHAFIQGTVPGGVDADADLLADQLLRQPAHTPPVLPDESIAGVSKRRLLREVASRYEAVVDTVEQDDRGMETMGEIRRPSDQE